MKNKKQFRKNNLTPAILVASFFLLILAGFLYSKPFKVLKEVVAVGGTSVGLVNLNLAGTTFTPGGIWKSDGKVGIGTTSPNANLEVSGALATPANIFINNTGGSWTDGDILGKFSFYTTDASGIGARELAGIRGINRTTGVSPSGELALYTSLGNGTQAEAVRISTAGNVGIGTTAPAFLLDVNGTAEMNTLSIAGTSVTATAAEINLNDGQTATAAEVNILDGVTGLTFTELTTLGGIAATLTAAELNLNDGQTATAAEVNVLDGILPTVTELNYVNGVTSAIQTQLGTKAPLASPTFTGNVSAPNIYLNVNDGGIFAEDTSNVANRILYYGNDNNVYLQSPSANSQISFRVGGIYSGNLQFYFHTNGTGYANTAWTTFSPYLSYNYAEPGKTKSDYKLGQIVALKPDSRWAITPANQNNNQVYGVVVLPDGFISIPKELKNDTWDSEVKIEDRDDVVPVAHLGEASTMITLRSGQTILPNDPLVASTKSGFATKSTVSGTILGRALESTEHWNNERCPFANSIDTINWPEDDGSNPSKPCFKLPDGSFVGKIMVFVNVSWYDPDIYLTDISDFKIVDDNNNYSLKDKNNSIISRFGAFTELVVAKIQVGLIETKKLIVGGVDILKKLNELSLKVESQQKQIDELKKTIQELKK